MPPQNRMAFGLFYNVNFWEILNRSMEFYEFFFFRELIYILELKSLSYDRLGMS